jgi:glycerol-3-phosphate dehydrogenase subunit C
MEENVAVLAPYVERGLNVVTAGVTCGMTMKKEWPVWLASEPARRVAEGTLDLMQFLDGLRRAKKLNTEFVRGYGKVTYHAACHLRAQKVGIPGARLLGLLPDTEVRIIERCSAVDGTWGMKARFYDEGARYGGKLAKAIASDDEGEQALVIGDCNLAALRVYKENGKQMLHPAIALAEAYGIPTGSDLSHEPTVQGSKRERLVTKGA